MGVLGYLILFLTLACAKSNKPYPTTPHEKLKEVYDEKLAEAKRSFDSVTGWPSPTDCDGTLWAGIALAGGVSSVNIHLAEHSPGEIHRRPYRPCWENGVDMGSPSTVSRDMLQGYFWGLWALRDVEAFKRLASYGEAHNWFMGKPVGDGRVVLSGNGIGTLGRAIKKLGGPDKIYRHTPYVYTSGGPDYAKHLTALGILLNGEIDGGITSSALETLEDLATEQPKDALFCAAYAKYHDGCTDPCAEMLLGDYEYPSYVRGDDNYLLTHWLFTADLILGGLCASE